MDPRIPRLIGMLGGGSTALLGVWALAAPESFFNRLAPFEPYNQHFLQDIGAFQIGLGTVLLLAALAPSFDTLTVALLGTGLGAAAHAVSHIIGRDLGGRPSTDIPMFTLTAVLLVGAGLVQRRATSGGGARAPRAERETTAAG